MRIRLIRKNEVKKYLVDTFLYGIIFGFILFLILLIGNKISDSAINGFILGVEGVLIIQIFRFVIKEIIIRKSRIKKLTTTNFKTLNLLGLYLQDDLFFKGNYNGFTIHIYPRESNVGNRKTQFFTINIYYNYPVSLTDEFSRWKFDQENSKIYKVGKINFGGHVAILHPESKYSSDFISCITFMINILGELNLTPIKYSIWEKKYILPIKEKHLQERKQTINSLKKHLSILKRKIMFANRYK